ncbi:MAG TPA: VTT domain-containing protein [Pirellulales bacterium]|jgi:uncharacterized membrane protein YdjX (TVP38/TMEM64 family)|nr:VTT domain-containing protein [Pirellulales bacterium]
MRDLIRPLLIVALALAIPIVPFLAFGAELEAWIAGWLDPPPGRAVIVSLTVLALASDILLPVPSSLVSTAAGAQLGALLATAASWMGMTLGAVLGYWLARSFGRGVAVRLASHEDLDRLERVAGQYGVRLLVAARALPVLAEASVLLAGVARVPWRSFLLAVSLGNLGIAIVYSVLGQFARSEGELPLALAASIALPVLATTIARWWLRSTVREVA